MRLTIRLLGTEVLHISTDAEPDNGDAGDSTSYPVGFTRSPVWESDPDRCD